ncbi:DUF2637 domain-containing protein [Streptomyces sp. NPDC056652]|uniref:DUF2637 domain-containing protein n=1 Tax=Streptomyces sp. NPDC056652 TaxID=3345893 RepID=UPI0036B933F6
MTTTQKWLIGIVAAAVLTIATLGFIGSYEAVSKLAEKKDFGSFAKAFPIAIDAGIVAFLALDLLLTWRRIPYPLLRQGAWLLTAATIAFNAAAAWPDWLGVGMHGVIPVLFVIAVEAARHAVGRIADITADKHIENPPLIRWFVAPLSTAYIWRRMRKWHIRQYTQAIQHQQEVKIYRARLRQLHGSVRRAPEDKRIVLTLAGYGKSIAEAIELPQEEQRKRDEAEAKQRAEARAKAEAEAEVKHQAELRNAEAEAKRRTEIAEAEAAEARAKAEVEAAEAEAEAARVEAKLRAEVAQAEAEANLKTARVRAETAETEANLRAEAEAEKIRIALRSAEAQAHRDGLVSEAEAESKRRVAQAIADAAAAEANQNLQVKQRIAQAQADAQIADIARQQKRTAEQDEVDRRARERAETKREAEENRKLAEQQKQQKARTEAARLRELASTSTSETASGSGTVAAKTSDPASVSVRISSPETITNRRSKRQSEVDEVLARIVQSGNPKSVTLAWVEQHFGLTQTTAYDRLSTAQKLWADGQAKSA